MLLKILGDLWSFKKRISFIFTFIFLLLISFSFSNIFETNKESLPVKSIHNLQNEFIKAKTNIFLISTKDGYLHAVNNNNKELWKIYLGNELMSSTVSTRKINKRLYLYPIDERLFIYQEGIFIPFPLFIKDLVQKQFTSVDDFSLIGKTQTSLFIIDIDTGEILQKIDEEINFSFKKKYVLLKNRNTITVIKNDYILNCLSLEEEQKHWNATYSEIVIQNDKNEDDVYDASLFFEPFLKEIITYLGINIDDVTTAYSYFGKDISLVKIYDLNNKNLKLEGEIKQLAKYHKQNKFWENDNADLEEKLKFLKYLSKKNDISELNGQLKLPNDNYINSNNDYYKNNDKYKISDRINFVYNKDENKDNKNETKISSLVLQFVKNHLNYILIVIILVLFIRLIYYKNLIFKSKKEKIEISNNSEEKNLKPNRKIQSVDVISKNISPQQYEKIINSHEKKGNNSSNYSSKKDDNDKTQKSENKKNSYSNKINRISNSNDNDEKNENENNNIWDDDKKEDEKDNINNNNNILNNKSINEKKDNKKSDKKEKSKPKSLIWDDEEEEEEEENNDEEEEDEDDDEEKEKNENEEEKLKEKKIDEKEKEDRKEKLEENFNKNSQKNNSINYNDNSVSYEGLETNCETNPQIQEIIKEKNKISRLDSDFENLEKIGQGGFGVVLKGKHKIDQEYYAIKIIDLTDNTKECDEIVSEAKKMNAIRGKHIVNYKICWYDDNLGSAEKFFNKEEMEEKKLSLSSFYSNFNSMELLLNRSYSVQVNKKEIKDKYKKGDCYIKEEIKEENEEETSENVNTKKSCDNSNKKSTSKLKNKHNSLELNKNNNRIYKKNMSIFKFSNRDDEKIYNKSILSKKYDFETEQNKHKKYFFILMEYCDGLTLEDFINQHANKSIEKGIIYNYTRQILKALKKLHENGIIHGDIKPGNIFIKNGLIKIGDFGLSTKLEKNTIPQTKYLSGYTPFYAAPELINSKTYDEKVDIYACGITLFEMCGCFGTRMEKELALKELKKKGDVEENIRTNYPKESELIKKMIQKDYIDRPSAKEILNEIYL